MKAHRWMICLLALMPVAEIQAQFSFSSLPVWQVTRTYPTGLGWADMDMNGFPDLVVAMGLDVNNGPTEIFFNYAQGLSSSPGWSSSFLAPGCNLVLHDLDHNGQTDIAVASLGLLSNGMQPVPNFLYLNPGPVISTPGWRSLPGNAFSCAGGDIDGDGDIDLAFSRGDYATAKKQTTVLFLNHNGSFDSIPNWQSDSAYYGTDLAFADIDLDGDLDLALGARTQGILVFISQNGVLETSPSWQTKKVAGGRQMAFGDVDGDGYPDLAVASPGQKFYLFKNNGGVLDTVPAWISTTGIEPSAVAWGDADGDGDLDLAAGSWNAPLGIFENVDGSLSPNFAWSKAVGNGVQQIAWVDYDEDRLLDTVKTLLPDGIKKVFYLGVQPVAGIHYITINGTILSPDQYCYDLTDGWISLAQAPETGDAVTVSFTYSNDLDLSLTNWGAVKIFENLLPATGIDFHQRNHVGPDLSAVLPNPASGPAEVRFYLPEKNRVSLKLINNQGQTVATLAEGEFPEGMNTCTFRTDGLPRGMYACCLAGSGFALSRKLVLIAE